MYEQMHMEWEHKEQDAFQWVYQSQPWIRSSVGFLPQRKINAFPPGACGDENDPAFHYQEEDHDLVVNMAGCSFGRDCWAEIYNYREISERHNRSRWAKVQDAISAAFQGLFGGGGGSDSTGDDEIGSPGQAQEVAD